MLLYPGQKSEHFEKDKGLLWASFVAQLVKNLPAMQETWVRSLGWEDPLEMGKAIHSSILAWRICGLRLFSSVQFSRSVMSDFATP